MILRMNRDSLGTVQNPPFIDSVLQEMGAMIGDVWRTVTEVDGYVVNITPFFISCSDQGDFTLPFNQLLTRGREMASPVMTARTGVICP
ncbi:hypothetical protein [Serratia quinivorans]